MFFKILLSFTSVMVLLPHTTTSVVRLATVEGVVGGKADLPCDVTTSLLNDTVLLVAWYRDDNKAIYSVDHRIKQGPTISDSGGLHWSEPDLEQRVSLRYDITRHGSAALTLDKLRESDEGLYRCRVDFRTSPTHNNKVRLNIIVPSEKPRIVDERGKTLSAVAGPYEEGSSMSLTCVVSGGRPRPDITWWLDGAEIKSGDGNSVSVGATKGDGRNGGNMDITTRLLVVQKLSRSQLHTCYTCMANNSNKTTPLMSAVTVEMLLAPLSVNFVNTWQPLSKGKEFTLECQSYGSRPPAKITWWKDNLKLNTSEEQVSDDGNVTTSKLIFTPLISDHDGRLTCRAHNPRLATGVLEQAWKLDVFYLPKVRLELGSKLNPKKIKEGDDVYFECIVDSNPNAYKVIWRHNKVVVANNPKGGGVMVTDSALAIQAVGRKNAGNYSCTAYNVEGDGRSNYVHLTVIYKPVCKVNYIRTVVVGRNEDIKLSCEVDSYPPATDYQWLLNNTSGTSLELTSGFMGTTIPSSVLIYRPTSDADYGSLACKAANIAGVQDQPCLFIIIPAGGPEPLENCSLIEHSTTSASMPEVCISCEQTPRSADIDYSAVRNFFHLEIHDRETTQVLTNLTRNTPLFCISGRIFTSSSELLGIVYSSNSRGVSERLELHNLGYRAHSQAVGGVWGGEKQGGSTVATVISGILGLIAVVIGIFQGVRYCWSPSGRQNSVQAVPVLQQHIPKLKAVADTVQQQQPELTADNNPDIIPYERESDYEHIPNENHNGRNKTTVRRGTPEEETTSCKLYDSRQHTLLALDADMTSRSGTVADWSEWGDMHGTNSEPGLPARGSSRQVISIRALLGSSDQLESRV